VPLQEENKDWDRIDIKEVIRHQTGCYTTGFEDRERGHEPTEMKYTPKRFESMYSHKT